MRKLPRHLGMTLLVAFFALISGCATMAPKPPVTLEQVVEMSQQGTPAEEIIDKMRRAGTVYRVPASALAKLKERGVPDPVLDYMQGTYLEYSRRQGMRDSYFWGGYWGGPGFYSFWGSPGYWRPYPYWRYRY